MPEPVPTGWARLRARFGQRATGIVLALVLEALLIGLLLTLGRTGFAPPGEADGMVTFDVRPPPEQAREEETEQAPRPEAPTPARPAEFVPPDPTPEPQPALPEVAPAPRRNAVIIPLSRAEVASADLANQPRRPERPDGGPAYGPSAAGSPGDSELVGRAPNGEPLYAARWFREPTDGELRGYLSTASGPGWALIACKTAPQWRVEECVGLEEYPGGSNIQRAVLAAAWQFQVRPPRRGGVSLVGSWVRIRIEYSRQ